MAVAPPVPFIGILSPKKGPSAVIDLPPPKNSYV
ncbi:unnamed protein product, partial [marine sediment metagenome]